MGLEKAILHKKEHRKPYQDSRAFDTSCRNHASCGWCYGNRVKHKKRLEQLREKDELAVLTDK